MVRAIAALAANVIVLTKYVPGVMHKQLVGVDISGSRRSKEGISAIEADVEHGEDITDCKRKIEAASVRCRLRPAIPR